MSVCFNFEEDENFIYFVLDFQNVQLCFGCSIYVFLGNPIDISKNEDIYLY